MYTSCPRRLQLTHDYWEFRVGLQWFSVGTHLILAALVWPLSSKFAVVAGRLQSTRTGSLHLLFTGNILMSKFLTSIYFQEDIFKGYNLHVRHIYRTNNQRHQLWDMYKATTVTFVRIYDKITNKCIMQHQITEGTKHVSFSTAIYQKCILHTSSSYFKYLDHLCLNH